MKTVDLSKIRLFVHGFHCVPTNILNKLNITEDEPFQIVDKGGGWDGKIGIIREFRDRGWQPFIVISKEQADYYFHKLFKSEKKKKEYQMTNKKYEFTPQMAFANIATHMKTWAMMTGAQNFVVGISGGKDSTVVAMILCAIFGKEHVHGVLMPQGSQHDIADSFDVVRILGISHSVIDIGDSVDAITKQIWDRRKLDNAYPTKDMEINLPARIRMSTLHAVGQCINGRVINTSNLSEDMVGYATQFGDNAGAYAPLQGLTVTEVKQIGKHVASLLHDNGMLCNTTIKERMPDLTWQTYPIDGYKRLINLVDKTPADGLQAQSDEERLGITYKQIDDFIRFDKGDEEVKNKIRQKYKANKFKLEIVQMPQPDFSYLPNFVKD